MGALNKTRSNLSQASLQMWQRWPNLNRIRSKVRIPTTVRRRQCVPSRAQRFLVKWNMWIIRASHTHLEGISGAVPVVVVLPWQTGFYLHASSCCRLVIVKLVRAPFCRKCPICKKSDACREESTTEEDAASTAQSRQQSHVAASSTGSSWDLQCCQSGPN